MGVFEFVIVIVLIATVGEAVKARVGRSAPAPPLPRDTSHLEESLEHLNQRMLRLEEERDFYRALLEPAKRESASRPPDGRVGGGSGPSEASGLDDGAGEQGHSPG